MTKCCSGYTEKCTSCYSDKNLLKSCVIIISVVMGLLGSWLLPFFIFGEKSFLISRYYSAKTLHMHRVTTREAFPNQWNSLGPISPYYEADNQPHLQRVRQPTPYFVYKSQESTLQSALLLPHDNTFYINGETLSILSSI
jgi:hypothetical protein